MTSRTALITAGVGAVTALAVAGATPALARPPAADSDTATVSVLHAVPGLTVDVYADGRELVPDFKPGDLTDPRQLDAGSYDIQVFEDGEGPDGEPAVQKKVEVPAGADATVVAHLDENGTPTLDAYVNDLSKPAAGKARLTVRHVAAAPPVDVRAGGTPVFKDLTNPDEAKGEVTAGTVRADVVLAGTDTVAVGPADLNLAEGTHTVVYAWGSAQDENLALKTQTFDDLRSSPTGSPTGGTGTGTGTGTG
ncbi:DUF4397 domain-containing protein [Streptomyces sp. NPDC052701]|uniref:DUF4397 domain-containing protein n=1 Tax=Streptomyces sp. NPDC052701 TaxID=3155533 RepID=UPI003412A8B1